MRKFDDTGFGLIQALVAISIVSIAALGLSSLMVAQNNQLSYAEDRASYLYLEKEIDKLLSEETKYCESSLVNYPVKKRGKTKVPFIAKDPYDPKQLLLKLDPDHKNFDSFEQLKIADIYIEDQSVHKNGGTEGNVVLTIEAERLRTGFGTPKLKPIQKVIAVTTDKKTGKITNCPTRKLAGDVQCVMADTEDRIASAPSETEWTRSFRLPPETVAMTLNLSDGEPFTISRCSGEKETTCKQRDLIQYTIYPGKTKTGGKSFDPGAKIIIKNVYVGSKTDYTCSGNRSGINKDYRKEFYYDGILLATIEDDHSKYGNNCRIYKGYFPRLNWTTLPPLCPLYTPPSKLPSNPELGINLYLESEQGE